MKNITIALAAALAAFPNIRYLADFRYQYDVALQSSVCRSLLCSDELVLESATRHRAGGSTDELNSALTTFKEAVRRDPASAYRWLDLGDSLVRVGRTAEAQYCYDRALELGPRTTSVLWRVAQFYMRIKEPRRALANTLRILEISPDAKETVFNAYLLDGADVADTFEYGIPPRSPLVSEYFKYLLSVANPGDLQKAWNWIQTHSPVDDRVAGDYVDLLIMDGDLSLAAEAWKRSAGRHDPAYLQSNLVYNGDVELPLVQSGLDWRFREVPAVRIQPDSSVVHSGSSSLRIDFEGKDNIDFNHVEQKVIAPAGSYLFTAWIRTSQITTDEGVGFRLTDTSGKLDLRTKPLVGTNDWVPMHVEFTLTGPAHLIRIQLIRRPSSKFDNKLSGRVWIDSVSLVRRG